jgi:hypothetical protein
MSGFWGVGPLTGGVVTGGLVAASAAHSASNAALIITGGTLALYFGLLLVVTASGSVMRVLHIRSSRGRG